MQRNILLIACVIAELLFILLSSNAVAGPPFITDDPEPVAAQTWEVNYAVAKTWRDGSSSTAMPSVDINYGLTSNIQLHAQPRYSLESIDSNHQSGFDNTEVGIKYRFYDSQQDNQQLMIGTYPMVQLPTGLRKLGDTRGKTQFFLPLWAQLNTDSWTFYGGAGYRMNQAINSTNSWFIGVTALYTLSDKMKVGGELFSETKTNLGEPHTSGFNVGGIVDITEDYHLLFSAGQALNNVSASNSASVYIALQVIY